MEPDSQDPRGPLEKPSLAAALALLLPAVLCAGLFYLWLGDWRAALTYGGLLGIGLAAMGVEFYKFIHWHHADGKSGSAGRAVLELARGAFRVGFVKTFSEVMREILKLIGLKFVVSVVIAVTAFFVARSTHLL